MALIWTVLFAELISAAYAVTGTHEGLLQSFCFNELSSLPCTTDVFRNLKLTYRRGCITCPAVVCPVNHLGVKFSEWKFVHDPIRSMT